AIGVGVYFLVGGGDGGGGTAAGLTDDGPHKLTGQGCRAFVLRAPCHATVTHFHLLASIKEHKVA
ncbi:hypothetical protein ABZW51_20090, partial [Streptomyces cellulosae]